MMWYRIVYLLNLTLIPSNAFVTPGSHSDTSRLQTTLKAHRRPNENLIASTVLASSLAIAASNPLAAQSYVPSDYASETVQEAVQALKAASGNIDGTFKAYETIAEIITEGKGVGGMVNYKGVQLERGFISDEDTSIYNPGLTLLTESEKERLVEAVIKSRKDGISKGQWSENNEYAFEFLKANLDPLHMTELSGFLGFVPFYGALLYLGVLGTQQFARGLFPAAYLLGVVAFFGPIIALVVAGV